MKNAIIRNPVRIVTAAALSLVLLTGIGTGATIMAANEGPHPAQTALRAEPVSAQQADFWGFARCVYKGGSVVKCFMEN